MRKNSYKGNKTPFEIIKEEENIKYATLSKSILDFPTCILDEKLNPFIKGGYHVALPTSLKNFCYHSHDTTLFGIYLLVYIIVI